MCCIPPFCFEKANEPTLSVFPFTCTFYVLKITPPLASNFGRPVTSCCLSVCLSVCPFIEPEH